MNEVISREALAAKLRVATDEAQRRLYFAALLAGAAAVPTDEFFVVGGSAIEFYTVGAYTTGDIDIVSGRNDRLREILKSWTFRREGRVWVNEDLGLVVDLLPMPYTGDVEKTTVVTTPFGTIRVAAIEDLVVKRLISTKFWEQPADFDQAKLLALQFRDRMDWEYVERFAHREDVSDLLVPLREAIEPRGRTQARRERDRT